MRTGSPVFAVGPPKAAVARRASRRPARAGCVVSPAHEAEPGRRAPGGVGAGGEASRREREDERGAEAAAGVPVRVLHSNRSSPQRPEAARRRTLSASPGKGLWHG